MRCKTLMCVFFLGLALIFPVTVFPIQDGDPVSLGEYKIIPSKILKEDRTILVHLPVDYQKMTKRYPVFYMLYGNHVTTYFAETVSVLDRLGSTGRIPEMILVGIANTDRYRDLLPKSPRGGETGIENFVGFLKDELVPYVEKNYRCKNYRMVMGPQAGANFVFYTLFKFPDLFHSAIINNPFRWRGGRKLSLRQAKDVLRRSQSFSRALFISYDDADQLGRAGIPMIEDFSGFVGENNPGGFRLYLHFEKGWDEFIQPLGLRQGLKKIFSRYPVKDDSKINGLEDLKKHFGRLSELYGYEVDIPEHFLTNHYYRLNRMRKIRESREILNFILEKNPNSLNGLNMMANVHYGEANLPEAIKSLEKMLAHMDSDTGGIKRRIEQFRKMEKESAAYALHREILDHGLKAAKRKYPVIKNENRRYFNETELNQLGYQLLGMKKLAEAIFIFKVNVEQFPHSPNAYDSLGEAYFHNGNMKEAETNYKKVLEMDPKNQNAQKMLKKIRNNQ